MGSLQIVWFKRDLRSFDHRPLLEASLRGPVLPLYVVEPDLWRQPDSSSRQWDFCRECLVELRGALAGLGQPLVVRIGSVEQVLERARRQFGVAGLWSHEETGNAWTYARDLRVAAWARQHGIEWQEVPHFGVVRRLARRTGWAKRWEQRMAEELANGPIRLTPLAGLDPGPLPLAADLGLECPIPARGGNREDESRGWKPLLPFWISAAAPTRRGCRAPIRPMPAARAFRPISAGEPCRYGRLCSKTDYAARPLQRLPGGAPCSALMRGCTGIAISSRSWNASRTWNSVSSIPSPLACGRVTAIAWRPGRKDARDYLLWMPACGR
jgi:hypothetical protein